MLSYPGELAGDEGYNFRILKAQGPHGDGGAKSYVQSGRMTGGFAMVTLPAELGSSGIMTFIVGPDGDLYQLDACHRDQRLTLEDGVVNGHLKATLVRNAPA